MLVEYAIARLAGLKRQFPTFAALERMAAGRDGHAMARLLTGTVFEPEVINLAARKDIEASIPLVLRLVNEGSLRMRRLFALRAAQAWPERRRVFAARWELEEIKSAMRYLTFGGEGLEKRFAFVSFIMDAKRPLWNAHMKPAEFQKALVKAGHPLAGAVDTEAFADDPVKNELQMERYFFLQYLKTQEDRLCAGCHEYFRDQLDMINAKNAWLLRGAEPERKIRPELFIAAGGNVGLEDFLEIATGPSEAKAIERIQTRMRILLDPEKLDSPYGLSTAIRNALLKKYRRMYIENPGGVWAFFHFAEELNAMIADVRNAIYCGATCSTVDVVTRRFIGARPR
ncbi:MAG: V-type ATPase subunit [Nitrospinota bacterium]|nr:V-type ATPase subunit [Nitrospinota bacterium]